MGVFKFDVVDENRHLLTPFDSVATGGDVQELGGVFSGTITVAVLPSGRCFPIRVRNCVVHKPVTIDVGPTSLTGICVNHTTG
jgi:hypothetical protein